MRNILIIAFALILPSTQLKAQDYIKTSQIYLVANGRNIKFNDIKLSSVTRLVGNPIKIKKDRPETTDEPVTTFTYTNGMIDFETNTIAFLDINKSAWGFRFNIGNKITPVFTVGTDISEILKYFPHSYIRKGQSAIYIALKANNDQILDCDVIFEIKNNKVTILRFWSDES